MAMAMVVQQKKELFVNRNIELSLLVVRSISIYSPPEILRNFSLELIHYAAIHALGPTEVGEVTIRGHLMQTEDVPRDTKFVLLVEENGSGMHDSIKTTAFAPFTAIDPANLCLGLGLGLHVVVNLMSNALGNTIECDAGSRDGVRFTIELPFNSTEENNAFFSMPMRGQFITL